MIFRPAACCLLASCLAGAWLRAEDLPLPTQEPFALHEEGSEQRPTLVIKPPATGVVVVPSAPVSTDKEMALLELERRLVEDQARVQIAVAHLSGRASELKQLIVVNGPVDATISRAEKPPAAAPGRVALIGIQDADVSKSVEGFFGAPMTPDREQALLEAVKSQLSGGSEKRDMEVRIAGWWPNEGVMAVSVTPKS